MAKIESLKTAALGYLIIIVIIALNAFGPYLGLQQVVTFGLLPLLALIAIILDKNTLNKRSFEILVFFLFIVVSLLSAYYVINYVDLVSSFRILLATIVAAYIPIGINKNDSYENYFHIGFIASIMILVIVMYINGNISLTDFATAGKRDRFLLNANTYSYLSYFANISLFYLYLRRKSFWLLLLLLILPLIFILVSFATQSRSGILFILLINLCFWLFINKNTNQNQLAKFFKFLFIVIVLVLLGRIFASTYQNSQIKNRVDQGTTAEDSREVLAREALNVFYDNPFFGVGLGQFPRYSGLGQFSHNSYTEILAEHGIIGGFLILLLFGVPLVKSWQSLRKNWSSPILRLNLLFLVTFLLYNNAYVFYKSPFSMMYFFLIISIQNKIYHGLQHTNRS